ncbi:MAG: mycofactocin biosynthesis glycosyltransferase MftF [Acidimicrobiales bacterium]
MPIGLHLAPDRELKVFAEGRAILGGSPLRLARLRPRAARVVESWLEGAPVDYRRADRALAGRLVAAGILHPRPSPVTAAGLVTIVVPVRDRPSLLASLLASLGPTPCIVVDDASMRADEIEKVARDAGAEYIALSEHRGPAAARNAGAAAVSTPLIAFVDSDCQVPEHWLDQLCGHFGDPRVAAVAPRVVTPPGHGRLMRYESSRSPLDLGEDEGLVAPGSRVPYVPAAAIVLRRAALEERPFDEALHAGEDVDLIWGLHRAGWQIRYVPSVVVDHASDVRPLRFIGRRFRDGSSAAPLARRHPAAAAPARVSPVTAVVLGLLVARRPGAAAVVCGGVCLRLGRHLGSRTENPMAKATSWGVACTARSVLGALRGLARAWSPVLWICCLTRHCGRWRVWAAAALLISATRGLRARNGLGSSSYLAASLADDLAYGTGVWVGAWRERMVRPLMPRVALPARVSRGIKGLLGALGSLRSSRQGRQRRTSGP